MAELKNGGDKIPVLVKSILLGIITYLVLLLIMDGVFLFTSLSEDYMGWAAVGALGIGCFLSGMKAGSGMEKRGLLWGFVTASVIILIISLLVRFAGGITDPSEMSNIKCAACIVLGCVGGMVGVNR